MNAMRLPLVAGCVSSLVSVTSGPPALRTAGLDTSAASAANRT
jgi:hypothetical protein